MRATVLEVNGLLIRYRTETGIEDIDDSTYDEIMNIKRGDVIELSERRIQALKEAEPTYREDLMRK